MIPLPRIGGGWACILADPPWRFSDRNTRGAAEQHYPTMAWEEIALLPVAEVAAGDAFLALWFPDTHLVSALTVARNWGFLYQHLIVWGKVKDGRVQIGLGHRFRKSHEVAMLCSRGNPRVLDHSLSSLILAPRAQHSRKPVEIHERLERFCAGPRLELFARGPARRGWWTWGDEAEPTRQRSRP